MASEQPAFVEEAIDRFKRHFPKGRDVTLIILKGHLLVEEQLNALLATAFAKPEALAKARLSFPQRICLLSAAYPHISSHELLALEHLNSLRNLLAHRLEHPDLAKAICKFLDALWPGSPPRPWQSKKPYSLPELKNSVALLAGTLVGIRRGILGARGVAT